MRSRSSAHRRRRHRAAADRFQGRDHAGHRALLPGPFVPARRSPGLIPAATIRSEGRRVGGMAATRYHAPAEHRLPGGAQCSGRRWTPGRAAARSAASAKAADAASCARERGPAPRAHVAGTAIRLDPGSRRAAPAPPASRRDWRCSSRPSGTAWPPLDRDRPPLAAPGWQLAG